MSRIIRICKRFVNGFGFSNGCEELALKKPPPFVPSSFTVSWLAIGPPMTVWEAPATVS